MIRHYKVVSTYIGNGQTNLTVRRRGWIRGAYGPPGTIWAFFICSVFAFTLYAIIWFWYISLPVLLLVLFVTSFVKRHRKRA